jgi:glucan 1,3-beta-glucosidase
VTDTVYLPHGTRIMGQCWSTIAASNAAGKFGDAANPRPMLQVGTPGERGVAQFVDLMISNQGPVPGAVLVEWNMHDNSNDQAGSTGMWDVHYRIGGAVGTNIDKNNCPKVS